MTPDHSSAAPEPWRSMWLRPRATIRWLIANDPERHILLLPALAGIHESLAGSMMQGSGVGMEWPGLVGIALVLGPILAIIQMLIFSYLLRLTGRWIGGRATLRTIITAFAWSRVPVAWALPLWLIAIALFGQSLFMGAPMGSVEGPTQMLALGLFSIALVVTSLWTLVLLVMGLAEVQGFTGWRALGNILLAILIVFMAAFVLVLLLALLLGNVA